MERILTQEERIRRAEEIYNRRKAQGVRVSTSSVNVGKTNKISLGKKMIFQIAICILIYAGVVGIKGYNNIFSQNVVTQTKNILEYDIDIPKMYKLTTEYITSNGMFNLNNSEIENVEEKNEASGATNGEVSNTTTDGTNETSNEVTNSTPEEVPEVTVNQTTETPAESSTEPQAEVNDGTIKAKQDSENMEQMMQDAEYIKQNYSLIEPVKGNITSGFGQREETEIISAFHQGVDISATAGTAIKSAMEGDVVAASYAGDYGNHIKIQNGEVLTVYAHCSKLEVNVGDHIMQGQEIAKVGATGKATGPHLHFEIRREGRFVNPELVLKL